MLSSLKFQSSWWDGGKSESTRTYSANEVTSMTLAALDTENSTLLTPQLRNAQRIWTESPPPRPPSHLTWQFVSSLPKAVLWKKEYNFAIFWAKPLFIACHMPPTAKSRDKKDLGSRPKQLKHPLPLSIQYICIIYIVYICNMRKGVRTLYIPFLLSFEIYKF